MWDPFFNVLNGLEVGVTKYTCYLRVILESIFYDSKYSRWNTWSFMEFHFLRLKKSDRSWNSQGFIYSLQWRKIRCNNELCISTHAAGRIKTVLKRIQFGPHERLYTKQKFCTAINKKTRSHDSYPDNIHHHLAHPCHQAWQSWQHKQHDVATAHSISMHLWPSEETANEESRLIWFSFLARLRQRNDDSLRLVNLPHPEIRPYQTLISEGGR